MSDSHPKYRVRICLGSRCKANFSKDLLRSAEMAAEDKSVIVEARSCMAQCSKGPNLEVIEEATGKTIAVHNTVMPLEVEGIIKKLAN